MSFIIEFDDNHLIERIWNPYQKINAQAPLGMSFLDFISLGEDVDTARNLYLTIAKYTEENISSNSALYSKLQEYIKLCVKDPSLFTLDVFMFFVHLNGATIPQSHLAFEFDPNYVVEDLVYSKKGKSRLEISLKGFEKSDKSKCVMKTVYTCENVQDLCFASIYHMINLGLSIKVCQNCNKYFTPMHRSDTIYCDRKSPFHHLKSCKQDGSIRTYAGKAKLDETENLQRKIYQSKKMLIRRNPDISEYQEKFEVWKKDVIRWRKDIKKGHRTSEEFVQWLNHSRKRK